MSASSSSSTVAHSATGAFTPDAFAAHLATQPSAPAWWLDRKRAAYESFASLPMPKRTDEAWRFSSIATLTLADVQVGAGVPAGLSIESPFGPVALTFVNNTVVRSGERQRADLPPGVLVTTLSDALANHSELLRKHFMAQPQKLGSEKFAALHTAFIADGAFIHIPRGVEVAAPIVVVHAAAGANTAVFPHTLVIADDNSKATVIDYFVSLDSLSPLASGPSPAPQALALALGANDLYAAHGAHLTYVAAQAWSRDTLSFQLNSTVVRRDARVQSLNLHLGARQARHESLSQLQAPGAFSEMLALTVADGTQEFDQRTLQIHQAPNTKSDLLYKNALRDKARTIFSGLIVVDPDAQKTDAYQSNRNLMLSDDAEANSLPGLEIQANDVRCTHGATSSRIDPEQEFYLRSRGISKAAADELLTFGFFEEVLQRLESEPLHDALRSLIQTQFQK
ncbi:MAG TPA: Fe-S cluster assembly protein SufD [Opitutus sp.]|nr:Fe-S cluster assembly protein SufD [Opitutus sp.]